MASQLAEAHKRAQTLLQTLIANAVAAIWHQLGRYDQVDVDPFLAAALPVVEGGQQQSAALTAAFIARSLGIAPFGINPAFVTGAAVRAGTPPDEVYRRAFIGVWHDLSENKPWEEAVRGGEARVRSSASTDVALAARESFQIAQEEVPGIYGYQRVASATACEFCLSVSGAYVKSAEAMPLHNNCACSLQPLTKPHPKAQWLPDGTHVAEHYAVREHGELGPVLVGPHEHFTTEHEIGA